MRERRLELGLFDREDIMPTVVVHMVGYTHRHEHERPLGTVGLVVRAKHFDDGVEHHGGVRPWVRLLSRISSTVESASSIRPRASFSIAASEGASAEHRVFCAWTPNNCNKVVSCPVFPALLLRPPCRPHLLNSPFMPRRRSPNPSPASPFRKSRSLPRAAKRVCRTCR